MSEQENDMVINSRYCSVYTYKFRNGFTIIGIVQVGSQILQECAFGQWSIVTLLFKYRFNPWTLFLVHGVADSSNLQGDINNDGVLNVVDVVSIVDVILYDSNIMILLIIIMMELLML